jgi:type 1 glutamine amidotransferase
MKSPRFGTRAARFACAASISLAASIGLGVTACHGDSPAPVTSVATDASVDDGRLLRPLRILFFTKMTMFDLNHKDTHTKGDVAVPAYLRARGHTVTVSDDAGVFTDDGLAPFDVALFFVTAGHVMTEDGRAAFQRFIESGHGYAGVHTANATEWDWPFMSGLLGVTFAGHPDHIEPGDVYVEAPDDPLVSFLPSPWRRQEEWYFFSDDPKNHPELQLLLRIDESSLADYPEAGLYGANHAIAWKQTFHGARSFYTSMGHTPESYDDELFLRSIALGVEWAGAPTTTRP